MADIWFTSDTHFGHGNILAFTREDGSKMRAGFRDIEDMNERLIENWNRFVKPADKIYHLGDVCLSRRVLADVMPRLKGRKRLVLGNHDTLDMKLYAEHFEKIASWRHFTGDGAALICTHYPLHPAAFLGRYPGSCLNVHGHIHARNIADPRYVNVSVEQTNYAPVSYDWLMDKARALS